MRHLLRNQKKTSQSKLSSLGRPVEYVNKKFHNQKFWVEIQKKKKKNELEKRGRKTRSKFCFEHWILKSRQSQCPILQIEVVVTQEVSLLLFGIYVFESWFDKIFVTLALENRKLTVYFLSVFSHCREFWWNMYLPQFDEFFYERSI